TNPQLSTASACARLLRSRSLSLAERPIYDYFNPKTLRQNAPEKGSRSRDIMSDLSTKQIEALLKLITPPSISLLTTADLEIYEPLAVLGLVEATLGGGYKLTYKGQTAAMKYIPRKP
ncbi:MAG: hypothetical protein P4M15_05165, partial [Alphaproteobacteria bacterium]|nr:hypothetical protein [Alphaproteobacteria bacterium]